VLRQLQNDLFDVGADLCTPVVADPKYPPLRITDGYISRLEGWCDHFNADLPSLASFILPGGTPGAALLHVARTVARRAERSTWALIEADPERTNKLAATYLNRLSDLLFILSRCANSGTDVLWQPGGGQDHAAGEQPMSLPPALRVQERCQPLQNFGADASSQDRKPVSPLSGKPRLISAPLNRHSTIIRFGLSAMSRCGSHARLRMTESWSRGIRSAAVGESESVRYQTSSSPT